jgi:hypothetical protein
VLVHFLEDGRWVSPVEMAIEGQNLTAEDHLFILMQAALYLTATRALASTEAKICYERAESLCHSLIRPLLLYSSLISLAFFCAGRCGRLEATQRRSNDEDGRFFMHPDVCAV